jgi:hypothetical protein
MMLFSGHDRNRFTYSGHPPTIRPRTLQATAPHGASLASGRLNQNQRRPSPDAALT